MLTVGWPLVSLAFSGAQPLRSGDVLVIGPDAAHRAQFTVGSGWVLQRPDSNPKLNYVLRHGAVRLSVVFVFLASRDEAGGLWTGLGRLLHAANPAAHLSGPTQVTSSRGARGLTGVLRQDGKIGQATIYPSPGKTFAIEMISLGPPGAGRAQAAARQVIRSLSIPRRHP